MASLIGGPAGGPAGGNKTLLTDTSDKAGDNTSVTEPKPDTKNEPKPDTKKPLPEHDRLGLDETQKATLVAANEKAISVMSAANERTWTADEMQKVRAY
jgi:hypothetical protein